MLRPAFACSLLALAAPACTSSDDPPEVKSDLARNQTPSPADLPQLVHDNTAFAADLYTQVAQAASPKDNLFLSAHSISTALAMTYAGAETSTATQMAAALHFTLPPAQLHAAFDALDLELAKRATAADSQTIPFQLHNASSLWGQEGMEFQEPFLDTLAVNYGAGLRVQDFIHDPDGSRGTINKWVSSETNGKIPDLLAPGTITPDTRFVIANAIYFTAAWADPFKESDTTTDTFHAVTGDEQIATMHGGGEWMYGSGAGYEAVEIPYDGDQLGMIVVVPDDLTTFEQGLDGAGIEAIEQSLHGSNVVLSLPKFEFSSPFSLKDALNALGMTSAFTPDADFSGIDGARDLYIAAVIHKGFLHIDEKGTEAAAATAVIGAGDAEVETHTVTVDKPFLIFIHDRPTNAILFQGRMVDPSAAQGE